MTTATASLPSDLITRDEICESFRFTHRNLGRLIEKGKFPAPIINLSPRLSRWRRSDIEAFLANQESRGAQS